MALASGRKSWMLRWAWPMEIVAVAVGLVNWDTSLGNFFAFLSFSEHYDRLIRGLLEVKDIVYYISGIVLALFLAHEVLDSHRWS